MNTLTYSDGIFSVIQKLGIIIYMKREKKNPKEKCTSITSHKDYIYWIICLKNIKTRTCTHTLPTNTHAPENSSAYTWGTNDGENADSNFDKQM